MMDEGRHERLSADHEAWLMFLSRLDLLMSLEKVSFPEFFVNLLLALWLRRSPVSFLVIW